MLQVTETLVNSSTRVDDWLHIHPASFPPKSYALNQAFVEAMRKLDKEWEKEHGISWEFGEEIEFTLTEKNKPIQSQQNRKALIDELSEHFGEQFTTDMGAETAAEIEEKIEALQGFSLPELVMCKLHEMVMPEELEYRFGIGALGDGHYDFPPVLEVRVAKQPTEQAVKNYNKTVATITEIAKEYDLSPRFYRHHLNFSANRKADGTNLTQINDEESLEFSSKAAVREASQVIHGSKSTAHRALAQLKEHGFVAMKERGRFTTRLATTWMLQCEPCDGKPAASGWREWRPENRT